MNRFINRLKIAFIAIFAVSGVAIWSYHLVWVWPGQKCEAHGWWWDWRTRTCAMPVPLSVFTGKAGAPKQIVPENPEVQQAPTALAPGQTPR
jgi:hypothetical protein